LDKLLTFDLEDLFVFQDRWRLDIVWNLDFVAGDDGGEEKAG
jgi:hypothetical protein